MSRRHLPIRTSPKRRQHLHNARQRKEQNRLGQHGAIEDARRFAFSILVNGANDAETASVFLWNDITPPSKSTFSRAQGTLLLRFTDQCLLNCQRFREKMLPGSIVAFDGSWSHRRGAKECIVVFVDCRTKKIVDFKIMQKLKSGLAQNFHGFENGMELAALRELIRRWKDDPIVIGCVHDCDAKASKAIRDAGWNVTEYYDLNRIVKAFDRRWHQM
jgi:hypothetical protein